MTNFTTQSKVLKIYVEKVSELILKESLRLHQLEGIDQAEIVVPFTNSEISSPWDRKKHWPRAFSNFWERLATNKYPQSKKLQITKRTNWILPNIIQGTPISGAPHFILVQTNQERQVIGQEI